MDSTQSRRGWSRSPEIQFNGLAPLSVHAFCGHRVLKALHINHHHLIWTIDFFLLYLNTSNPRPEASTGVWPHCDYWCGGRRGEITGGAASTKMLQTNMLKAEKSPQPSDRSGAQRRCRIWRRGGLINFALGLLRRQYLVIILTAVFALTSCIIYLRITPPTYTARAQVLLANPRAQFVQQQSILSEPAFDLNQIETQIQLLKSSALATSVITQLNLVNDPDFSGSGSSLSSLWRGAPTWNSTPPEQSKAGTPARLSDAVITAFQDRLSANRVGMSSILEISFNSSNAERAAEIANAVAKAYITEQLNAKFEANRSATSWLQDRLRDLGDQALNAERAVNQIQVSEQHRFRRKESRSTSSRSPSSIID